ncbi:uncharacterized protein BJX67DRAFT_37322 [Aspergillus lucknowensis]|uniref:BHLH domain-containing protein n=1 Tax=Aspergillus lucknowensis TaxID=176173 RepID=A0ABR4LW69_9EURO
MAGDPLCASPGALSLNNGAPLSMPDYDAYLQNTLSSGLFTSSDEDPSFNFSLAGLPYIESPPSTDDTDPPKMPSPDMKVPVQPPPPPPPHALPTQPPSHRSYVVPLGPSDKAAAAAAVAALNLDGYPRIRRNSAPELDAHDMERQLKHASRRASHNIVEKRYRVNLNSKFRKLEEVVIKGTDPGSRTTPLSSSSPSSRRQQQSPKASIIDSALSYIESLESENSALRGKLGQYER